MLEVQYMWRILRRCSGSFFPNMKNGLLSKYEDKWVRPRAVVLHTTCSHFYPSLRPASLDRLQCKENLGGKKEKEERSSPLPS